MKALFRMVLAVAVLASLATMAAPPKIQIALLLDTSNSMDGLIEQAKTQLWNIVNEFALARYEGEMPELEIALYEYGNDGLPEENGYIRQVLPLTTDLDMISEKLFELTTNGGSEYCGWVIREAAEQLAWSSGDRDFKAIFIAGNEEFDQGKVDFRASCRAAIEKGIIVNTIFCGDHDEGVAGHWKEGADLADGAYMNIDQNRMTVDIPAPQDSELARLNQALNETYLPYGKQGEARKELQLKQDAYASGYSPGVLAQRTATKAKRFYKNAEWD
ncbi:MAG: VWA domain-containing protein, partial [Calditrichaeota bacterium]